MNRGAHIVFGVGLSIFILSRFFPIHHMPFIVFGSGFGAVFPDLDRGRWHRKLLHNIFSMIFFSLLSLALCIYLQIPIAIFTSFTLGYFSHLLGDMITYRGVALLFPFRNKFYRSPLVIGRSGDLVVNLFGIALGIIFMILGIVGMRI